MGSRPRRWRAIVPGFPLGKGDRVLREFPAKNQAAADAHVEALIRAGVVEQGARAVPRDLHVAVRGH